MDDVTFGGVLAVPLIIGLVEAAKRGGLPARWSAPLAIALGLALRLSYQLAAGPAELLSWLDALVQGLALGLAASGLYSGVKKLNEGQR